MKPNTSPGSSLMSRDLTANSSPYFFVRSRVSIILGARDRGLSSRRLGRRTRRRSLLYGQNEAVDRELGAERIGLKRLAVDLQLCGGRTDADEHRPAEKQLIAQVNF